MPGRAYRVPCRCGNVILLYRDNPGTTPSPLAPRKPSAPPRLPRPSERAPPASAARRTADPSAPTVPMASAARADGTQTAIVVSPPAAASPGRDERNLDDSDVSWSSTEPRPGVLGFLGGLVDRTEAFVLLHVTPARTITAAAIAAAIGLAAWISVATSGSTTTIMSLRTPEAAQQPADAPGRGARTRSPAQRSGGAAPDSTAIEIGDPLRLDAAPDAPVAAAGAAAEEPRAGSPSRAEPPAESSRHESMASERLVFHFGGEPTVQRASGAAPEGAAAEGGPGDKATRSTGRAPTAREAMAALGERQAGLEDCIDSASRSGDAEWLGRRVRVVMTFNADGRVSSADLADDEMAETALAGCIRAVAKKASVPAFEGVPVTLVVPLRLGTAR